MKLVLAASLAASLALGAVACRHHRHDPEEMRRFVTWRIDAALDDIDATDAQRQVVHAARDRILDRMQAGMAQHHQDAARLLAEWEKDTPDREAVRALLEQRLEERRQAALAALEEAYRIHEALTPAQRAQLAAEVREHMGD